MNHSEKKKARPIPEALWRPQDLPAALGVSRSTAWRMQQEEGFPPPRRITEGLYGWLPGEVIEWLADRPIRTAPHRPRGRHLQGGVGHGK